MFKIDFEDPTCIPIVFLMGGTATGKTDVAALLTEKIPSELISVDSSLVYRGMNIGTAKPDKEFLKNFPHHLVDIRDPDQTYSVADFCTDSKELVNDICQRNKVPILVGGTSFYFSAFENGLPDLPKKDEIIRQEIILEAEKKGWKAMHSELANLDPVSAKRINVNDPQRIQRALEIFRITGQPVKTELNPTKQIKNPILKIALYHHERKELHSRIEKRFKLMVEKGLTDEIVQLMSQYPPDIPAFRMIGYRQFIEGMNKNDHIDSMIEKSIISTRQLAKRQLTWLRNQAGILWVGVDKNDITNTANLIADCCDFWLRNKGI